MLGAAVDDCAIPSNLYRQNQEGKNAAILRRSFLGALVFNVLQGLVMPIRGVAPWEEIDRLSHVYQLHCVQIVLRFLGGNSNAPAPAPESAIAPSPDEE
ncbi:hypothetical protein V6N12_033630 [Hibiscus sabdariffa]|uniref:Uncharacterized protein n=1 Tax=Hibiscus sabdariffa TaxID=183260 RepID=A0ABR2BW57_9ROSI